MIVIIAFPPFSALFFSSFVSYCFQVQALLGEGGFAKVFMAYNEEKNENVALKVGRYIPHSLDC